MAKDLETPLTSSHSHSGGVVGGLKYELRIVINFHYLLVAFPSSIPLLNNTTVLLLRLPRTGQGNSDGH